MESNTPDSVKVWINTVFKDAINDDDILRTAATCMHVAEKFCDHPKDVIRIMIAHTVLRIARMDPSEWK